MIQPALVDEALLEFLVADSFVARVAIAELPGIASGQEVVGWMSAVKALDLERHSFDASNALYVSAKRSIDAVASVEGVIKVLPVAVIVKVEHIAMGDATPFLLAGLSPGEKQPFSLLKLRPVVWATD